jgi:hypothetical protein
VTMFGSEQAFWLIGLIVCLGACLVWAFCEIEARRQRQGRCKELIGDAMRSTVKEDQ